jgi:hypothetical protein
MDLAVAIFALYNEGIRIAGIISSSSGRAQYTNELLLHNEREGNTCSVEK